MRVKLEDVCKRIYAGGDVPKDRYSEVKTAEYSVPIYANAEKDNGLYGYTDKAREEELSITVAARGTIGFTAIRREPFLPVVRLITVVPDTEKVSERYLYYALKNCKPQSSGTSIPQLTVPDIKKNSIELYEISKQEAIADQLDRVNKLIEYRKQELYVLDDLVKARFVEMFGDADLSYQKQDWTPIYEIGTVVGGSTPKTNEDKYWNGEYRWISPAELKNDSGIIYDSIKKITKAGIDSCSLQELPIGTVILSSRAPIGKLAIAGNTFYCNQGFKNIVCNEKVLPRYLYSLLLFNTEYLNSLGRGATFKEISKSIVENIKIPLPSIERQKQFADFVVQIDKSKVVVDTQLLFDSLMQKYSG